MAHGSDACILLGDVVEDLFVVKAGERGSDIVFLAHFEVLAEVLVAAPPVGIDHSEAFVTSDLMDVGVANIILLSVRWVATVLSSELMFVVRLTESVTPVFNHLLLLVLNHHKQQEGLVQMPNKANPNQTDSILLVERIQFPVSVADWVFVESGNIFERSPLLSVVSGLFSVEHKFAEISISFLGESSIRFVKLYDSLTCRSYQRVR